MTSSLRRSYLVKVPEHEVTYRGVERSWTYPVEAWEGRVGAYSPDGARTQGASWAHITSHVPPYGSLLGQTAPRVLVEEIEEVGKG